MATPVAVTVAKRNRAAKETGRKSGKAVKEITKKIGGANFLDLLGNYLGRHCVQKTSTHIDLSGLDALSLLVAHKSRPADCPLCA